MGYENVLKYGCLDYRQHLLRALTSGSSKIYLLVLLVLLSSGVVKLIEMLLKKSVPFPQKTLSSLQKRVLFRESISCNS